jgi:hypothetical protein
LRVNPEPDADADADADARSRHYGWREQRCRFGATATVVREQGLLAEWVFALSRRQRSAIIGVHGTIVSVASLSVQAILSQNTRSWPHGARFPGRTGAARGLSLVMADLSFAVSAI